MADEEFGLEAQKELAASIHSDAQKIMFVAKQLDMAFPNNNVFRKAMLLAQTDAIRAWVQQVYAEELDLLMGLESAGQPEAEDEKE